MARDIILPLTGILFLVLASLVVVNVLVDWNMDWVRFGDWDLNLLLDLYGVGLLNFIRYWLLDSVRHWFLYNLWHDLSKKKLGQFYFKIACKFKFCLDHRQDCAGIVFLRTVQWLSLYFYFRCGQLRYIIGADMNGYTYVTDYWLQISI